MNRLSALLFLSMLAMGTIAQNTNSNNANDLKINVRNTSFVMKFVPHGTSTVVTKNGTRKVESLKNYYVSETEVTNVQWDAIMGTNYSAVKNTPFEVTWLKAQEFVTRLNNITGRQFRLISEDEWEFAASYGNDPSWWFSGSGNLSDVWRYPRTPVKSSKEGALNRPNKLGIYGMTNLDGEWCSDKVNYEGYTRVIRGKGSQYQEGMCKISYRTFAKDNFENACIRLALDYNSEKSSNPQPQNFAKNPVALPNGMSGVVFQGTSTDMHVVTINITKERRRLEAVGNKIGYGFVSISNYYGDNKKFHIVTKVTPAGQNAVNITMESQETGTKMTWKLLYSSLAKAVSVSSSISNYNKMYLQKR